MQVSVGYFFQKKTTGSCLDLPPHPCNHVKWVRLDGISKAKHPGGDEDSHPGALMAWPWSPQNDPIVDPMAHPHVTVTRVNVTAAWARLYANTLQGWYFGEDLFEETWRNKHHCNSLIIYWSGHEDVVELPQKVLTSNLSFQISKIHIAVVLQWPWLLGKIFPLSRLMLETPYFIGAVEAVESGTAMPVVQATHFTIQNGEEKTPTFQLVRQSSVRIVQRQLLSK